MRRLTAVENVTLDGVVQAPGRPDEDPRGGFEHGGWFAPYTDDVLMGEMAKGFGTSELLLGRRTYEDFYGFWPKQQDNPFTEVLDATTKYVASTTLADPLPWQNSVLLSGDAGDAVAELKQTEGKDLVVLGSGHLVRTLVARGLVDTLKLVVCPLVLGSGQRLFADEGTYAKLRLVDSVPTTTGVVVATYEIEDA